MMRRLFIFFLVVLVSCDDSTEQKPKLTLNSVTIGSVNLLLSTNTPVPTDQIILLNFSAPISSHASSFISLTLDGQPIESDITFFDQQKTLGVRPKTALTNNTEYQLNISSELTSAEGAAFSGASFTFRTIAGTLLLEEIVVNGTNVLQQTNPITEISLTPGIEFVFNKPLDESTIAASFVLQEGATTPGVITNISTDKKRVTLSFNAPLRHWSRYIVSVTSSLKGAGSEIFTPRSLTFYTGNASAPVRPVVSDEELLTLVQQQTFKYFWDFGHPVSGLARERNTSGDLVTIGGSGFGVMAIIVGIERGFITRAEGVARLKKMTDFLKTANRFHGAFPHWMNGVTGAVIPFSANDDGGDLVETSFLMQGLIAARQYLNSAAPTELAVIDNINQLYEAVEWDWYRREGQQVLYWHWSPRVGWAMNLPLRGYNETLITYVMAAASPTHTIPKSVYEQGFARNGSMRNGKTFYNTTLPLGEDFGGPLFFAHYSFLGLNPTNLNDQYADWWQQQVNHTLINRAYSIANPKKFVGYNSDSWGLTASDNASGYSAHSPTNDLGVITPTAALSSFPYTPEYSMQALKFFYYQLGDRLWGPYGFYDAFNLTQGWTASSTLAIDQGPIIIMIENHRTGLLWDLLMSAPEVQAGLTKLGFTY